MDNNRTAICLKDYVLDARIGVYEEERMKMQPIKVSVTLTLADPLAVTQDDINATVNYHLVREIVTEAAQSKHTVLCETLADTIARQCLNSFAMVESVAVDLLKIAIYDDCDVGVSLVRRRG
jgi:dihydroneopterin aldolase